jgi:hypothetical protein
MCKAALTWNAAHNLETRRALAQAGTPASFQCHDPEQRCMVRNRATIAVEATTRGNQGTDLRPNLPPTRV